MSFLKFLFVNNFCGFEGIVFVVRIFILEVLFFIMYFLNLWVFKMIFDVFGWYDGILNCLFIFGLCKFVLIISVLFNCLYVNVRFSDIVVLFFLGMLDVIIIVCFLFLIFSNDKLVWSVFIVLENWVLFVLKNDCIGRFNFLLCFNYGIKLSICWFSFFFMFLLECILLFRVFIVIVKKKLKLVFIIKVVVINNFLFGLVENVGGIVLFNIFVLVVLNLFNLLVFFKWVKNELYSCWFIFIFFCRFCFWLFNEDNFWNLVFVILIFVFNCFICLWDIWYWVVILEIKLLVWIFNVFWIVFNFVFIVIILGCLGLYILFNLDCLVIVFVLLWCMFWMVGWFNIFGKCVILFSEVLFLVWL